jgi:hypothetical protein
MQTLTQMQTGVAEGRRAGSVRSAQIVDELGGGPRGEEEGIGAVRGGVRDRRDRKGEYLHQPHSTVIENEPTISSFYMVLFSNTSISASSFVELSYIQNLFFRSMTPVSR